MTITDTLPAKAQAEARTRRLHVIHRTHYQYDKPVQRSVHDLHLRPMDGWKQTVLNYKLEISPGAPVIEYEDVFGNWAAKFELNEPYTELRITAESEVELLDVDPFAFAKQPIRPQFPLVWMPWERMMLLPYLASEELPATQLQEIYDYAMSFVKQNNGDLMETLFAINLALFREYQYKPGATCLGTTAFDVFTQKKGVCQDFANLFITMARLLGIPSRYVCGYLYTGHAEQNDKNGDGSRASSDASHAWVQLYIPQIGWKGFDPTNGVLPQLNHVRVGYGRHYRDTTPTSGTIYSPATETMSVQVEVREL